jgi:hypothetical protein
MCPAARSLLHDRHFSPLKTLVTDLLDGQYSNPRSLHRHQHRQPLPSGWSLLFRCWPEVCYSDVGQRPGWPHTDLAVFDVRLRKRRRNLAFVDWAVPHAICLDGQKSTSPTPPIDGISRPTFVRVCSRPMRRECQMEDSLRLNKFDLQRGCVS